MGEMSRKSSRHAAMPSGGSRTGVATDAAAGRPVSRTRCRGRAAGKTAWRVAMTARSTASCGVVAHVPRAPPDRPPSAGSRSPIRRGPGPAEPLAHVHRATSSRHRRCQRDRPVRGDGGQVRPGPRHDVDELVAAAAEGHPAAAADLVRQAGAGPRAACRWASTDRARWASGSWTWVSQPCWVTSTSGAKARTQRQAPVECSARSQAESPVPGGSATLTAVPCGVRAAGVAGEPGAGEERPPALVQRDGEHARVVPEDPLDAVAVVHVDVDVGHPLRAVVQQPLDADGDVVVDAEARGVAGHRVVQPAAEVHAVRRPRPSRRPRRRRRVPAAIRALASCMPTKAGSSSVPSPRACVGGRGVGRGRPHRRDVVGVVHRLEQRRRPALPGSTTSTSACAEAARAPRTAGPSGRAAPGPSGWPGAEVVAGEALVPDHARPVWACWARYRQAAGDCRVDAGSGSRGRPAPTGGPHGQEPAVRRGRPRHRPRPLRRARPPWSCSGWGTTSSPSSRTRCSPRRSSAS